MREPVTSLGPTPVQHDAPAVEIRRLRQLQEFDAAIDLQRAVFGFADIEVLPRRVFVTLSQIGGQAFGAFDRDTLIGFCLAYPAIQPAGALYIHSQMLGVHPRYQNLGIGRALKLEQRREALARQITLMEWVFDPLDVKTAYFNIEGLGCIVRRYDRNRYGASNAVQGRLPTDRCVAEWRMASERTRRAVRREAGPPAAAMATVGVRNDMAALRRESPAHALDLQRQLADKLEYGFRRGLAVIGFTRGETSGTYLLGRADDEPLDA